MLSCLSFHVCEYVVVCVWEREREKVYVYGVCVFVHVSVIIKVFSIIANGCDPLKLQFDPLGFQVPCLHTLSEPQNLKCN